MGTDDNFATGHRGYDDFDERRHRFRRRPPFAFFLAGMAVVLGVPAAGAGLLVMRDRALVSQANRYAAQYGVTDGGTATRAQRCQGLLLHDAANDPDGALPRSVVRMLAPRVCALAVARGLAHKSGDVGEGDAELVTSEVIRRMGLIRFRTVFNNALAVGYRLVAAAGKATRRDRCIASGLAAYDDRRSRDRRVPKRPRWARAVRSACTALDRRHELRVDGEPRATAPYDRLMDRYLHP